MSALHQSDWRHYGLCVCLYAEKGAKLLVGIWWQENNNKLDEWKALVDTVGIKCANLEDKLLLWVLQLPELPRCREKPQTAISCYEWLGRLKCLVNSLDASLSFLCHKGVLRIGHQVVFLFHQCKTFCNKHKLYSKWHWPRSIWNEQWSWWTSEVPAFSLDCEWKYSLKNWCSIKPTNRLA